MYLDLAALLLQFLQLPLSLGDLLLAHFQHGSQLGLWCTPGNKRQEGTRDGCEVLPSINKQLRCGASPPRATPGKADPWARTQNMGLGLSPGELGQSPRETQTEPVPNLEQGGTQAEQRPWALTLTSSSSCRLRTWRRAPTISGLKFHPALPLVNKWWKRYFWLRQPCREGVTSQSTKAI